MIPVAASIQVNWKTVAAVAVVGALVIWYTRKSVGEVAAAVNPVSPDNIFNKAVTATGAAVTGQKDWTLGGALYDATHTDGKANLVGDVLDRITGVK